MIVIETRTENSSIPSKAKREKKVRECQGENNDLRIEGKFGEEESKEAFLPRWYCLLEKIFWMHEEFIDDMKAKTKKRARKRGFGIFSRSLILMMNQLTNKL